MEVLEFPQYSDEWFAARNGIPTASMFDKIYTATGKVSTQADAYANQLIGDWLAGVPDSDHYVSAAMERGTLLEPDARTWYEFDQDAEVQQVGFVRRDDGLVGCSPDGLTPKSGIEIKCPNRGIHTGYLLANKIPTKYKPQVQGCMWLCERDTWDFVSFHPEIDSLVISVERDEEYIEGLEVEIDKFIKKMLAKRNQLIDMGYKQAPPKT